MDCKQIQLGSTTYAFYELPKRGKPKMLLLHGMMVESHCFEPLIEHLKEHFHLYLLDLKGHGKTGNGESYEDYRNEVITEELLAFHRAVIKEPSYLLGYSLGGQYTIKFAGTHSAVLRGAILIDSAPDLSIRGALKIMLLVMTTPGLFRGAENVRQFYDKKSPGFGDYMLEHCMQQDKYGYYSPRYDRANIVPKNSRQSGERAWELWQATKHIEVPVLVLRAEDSFIIDDGIQQRMEENIKQVQVVLMKKMGHNLALTHPQAVAEQILNFCA